MAVNQDNEFWRGFINLYKSLPELWQVKSDVYRDRHKKNIAYEKLIDYLKTKDKNATKETVKRKLNTLRGSYRRERKKVLDNWKPDARPDERYVTSLWYYDDLDFLNDQEIGADDESSFCENINESTTNLKRPHKRKNVIKDVEEPKEIPKVNSTNTVFKNMNDCSEIYGMAWAAQFRQLAPDQQIHAKRAMDEILYQGMLGNLPQTQSTFCQCLKPTNSCLSTPHSSVSFSTSWEERKFELSTLQIPSDEENGEKSSTKQEID